MPPQKRKRYHASVETMPSEREHNAGDAEWLPDTQVKTRKQKRLRQRKQPASDRAGEPARSDVDMDSSLNGNGVSTDASSPAPHSVEDTAAMRNEISALKAENERLTKELEQTRLQLQTLQAQKRDPKENPQPTFSIPMRPSSPAVTSTTTSRAGSPPPSHHNPLTHTSSLTSNYVPRPAYLEPPAVRPVRRLTPSGVMPPSFSPAPRDGKEREFAQPNLALSVRESGSSRDQFTFLKRLL